MDEVLLRKQDANNLILTKWKMPRFSTIGVCKIVCLKGPLNFMLLNLGRELEKSGLQGWGQRAPLARH